MAQVRSRWLNVTTKTSEPIREVIERIEAQDRDLRDIRDIIRRYDDLEDEMDMDSAITMIRRIVGDPE